MRLLAHIEKPSWCSATGPANCAACFFEEVCPLVGVEFLGFEHRDKIGIAEFIRLAPGLDVMPVFRRVYIIHIAGIPFVAEGGDRVNTPVEIYSEFRIAEPLGGGVALFEGFPIGGKRLL